MLELQVEPVSHGDSPVVHEQVPAPAHGPNRHRDIEQLVWWLSTQMPALEQFGAVWVPSVARQDLGPDWQP